MMFSTSSQRTSLAGQIRCALLVATATTPLRCVQPNQPGITGRNRKFIIARLAGYECLKPGITRVIMIQY